MLKIEVSEIKMMLRGIEIPFVIHAGIPSEVAELRRHQPCACGGKRDRLRITQEASFFCNQGDKGDMFSLIEHYLGIEFKDGLKLAIDFLGINKTSNREIREIKRAASLKVREAEIINKITSSNRSLDYNLILDLDDLIATIKSRDNDKLPSDAEMSLSRDVIININNRYENNEKKQQWIDKKLMLLKKDRNVKSGNV